MKNIAGTSNIFNFFKIIIINTVFIIMVLGIIDYSIYTKLKQEYIKTTTAIDIYPPVSYKDNYKADFTLQSYNFQKNNQNNFYYFRKDYNEEFKNKESILLFGCSFTYGTGLKNHQTLGGKLSRRLERNVYNFGISAGGIQHMLYLLQNSYIYKDIKETPSHVIFTYIPSHIKRLQSNIFPSPLMINGINLKYKIKNEKLKLDISPLNLFSKTFLVKNLYYQMDLKRDDASTTNIEYNAKLANIMFIESKKLLQKKYPNIKFVIFKYEINNDNFSVLENQQMWKELEKEGFTIIKSSDLIGRKFNFTHPDTIADNCHPSEYAWDLLVPKLINKLNLK